MNGKIKILEHNHMPQLCSLSFFFSFPLHSFSLIRIAQLVERKEANWKTRVTLKFSPESIYSAELIRSRGDNGANTVKHLGE